MTGDFRERAETVAQGAALIARAAPGAMKGFGALGMAATAVGALDTKTKELMALAIGIATHCDGCVAYRTRAAL
ncbi:carboxymuconolactone decarboxylase family protein [Neoroseomonas eburnea]|uniref:carboxymuconolactone decarboxylase family protein n=1 Tax=Neoroseomonas eburnea TaxID=1346889 RepID=UPI001FEA8034|nr:carboxymuconolactone decarboxylase family protein [Neoroseomonas eburnea]